MQIENWQVREGLKYDSNNFWVEIEGHQALIGLSDYGQWVIGDILYLDLAPDGSILAKGEKFGSVESGKWVGNLISPVNGRVLKSNASLVAQPQQIQADPYGTGWMMRIELAADGEGASLLDDAAYAEFVKEQIKNAA